MSRPISKFPFAWTVCLVFWPALQSRAQVSTANLTGMVEDATGARIAGAAVKLINSQTGTENDSTTSRDGIFLLPGVLPGSYTLQIGREGFATAQITDLILNVGDSKSLLILMEIGLVTQTVKIDASDLASAAGASVSTVIDRKFVANIPLNGRSFQDLISMTPGVNTQSPQAAGESFTAHGDFSVNGQQPDDNSFMVDGVSADVGAGLLIGHQKPASSGSAAGNTALGTTQSLVSIDDLQEFRVLTSSYSAEYGRTTGGQFTLLTRSGTDRLHGSAYDYVRNYSADAADWFTKFNTAPPPIPYEQNDFGGALGGPFMLPRLYNGQGRTFFFACYEGLHVTEPTAPLVEYVPSAQTIQGAPQPLQSVLEDFLFRSGSELGNTGLSPVVSSSISEPGSINATSVRFDHVFSPKLSAFFRYDDTPSKSESYDFSSVPFEQLDTQTVTLGATFQLSSTKTNELRLGYGASTSLLSTIVGGRNPIDSPVAVPPNLNAQLGIPESFPSASADVFIHSAGAGDAELKTDAALASVHQWNLRDTLAVQAGHQLMQFGIDERHLVSSIHPPALTVEADFLNLQSILSNSASDIAITMSQPATPAFNEFSAFLQDEWRVSKSLALSPGLRWDVDPPPHAERGGDAYTAPGNIASPASLVLAPRGTPLWRTGWLNFAPRLGAAWIPDRAAGRELVVRAGGGVFFDTDNRAAAPAFSALGFTTTMHPDNVPVPLTPAQLDFSTAVSPPYTGAPVFAFPRHLQLPCAFEWNVAVEKSFGRSQAFTASYVGTNGRQLLQEQRTNVSAQNPEFGEIIWFPPGLTSSYEGLQLKFQRSISPGIQVLASYAWSHTLDYDSTDPAWSLTRGNSNLDLRHNVEAALSWDEHSISGRWLRRYLLGGWGADGRVTARTGFPVTPLGNLFSDPATGNRYFSGVDWIQNRPLYLYGSQYPGGRMLNGGPYASNPAFVLPDIASAGNAPRNMLRGFGDNQINIAMRRDIHLGDGFGVQLRAEAYNLFNRPDFGYIDPSLTDALFGQAVLMLNQSFGPSGSLYEPGGPRSLQVSFRLHF
jgi:Carboxypeptidase regulatory-like domain/TonB-dependent Receptor Plug Domain